MTDTPTSNVTQADKKFLQTIVELCSLGGTGQALNVVRFYRESAEASQRERDAELAAEHGSTAIACAIREGSFA